MTTRRTASSTTSRRRFSFSSDSESDDDDAEYGMTKDQKPQPKKVKAKIRTKPASRRSVLEDELSTCSSAAYSDPELTRPTTKAKKASRPLHIKDSDDDDDGDDDSVDTAELVRRIKAGTQNRSRNTPFPTTSTLPQHRPLSIPSPVVSPRENSSWIPPKISMIGKKPLSKANAAIYDPTIDTRNDYNDDNDNDSVDTIELTRRLKTTSGRSRLFQTTTTNQMTLQQQETPLSIPSPVISPPKQQSMAKEPLSEADAAIYDPRMNSRMEDDDEIDSVDTLELTQRLKARYPPSTTTTTSSIANNTNTQTKIPQTIAAPAAYKSPPNAAVVPEIAFVLPPPSDSSSSSSCCSDSEDDNRNESESDDDQQKKIAKAREPTKLHPTTWYGPSSNANTNTNARTTAHHNSTAVPSVARAPSNPPARTTTTSTNENYQHHHQVPFTTTTNPPPSRQMMAPIPSKQPPLASNQKSSLKQSTINNPYSFQKKSLVQTTLNPYQKKTTQTVPSPLTERHTNSRLDWNPSNHNNDRQDQAPKSLHLSRPWSEEELLEEAFFGPPSPGQEQPQESSPATHTTSRNPNLHQYQNHCRMPARSNTSLHSREQQHLTTEQLFEEAFFSPTNRKPPPQPVTIHQQETRTQQVRPQVPQFEEELFHAAYFDMELPRQQQPSQHDDLVDLSLDASDDDVQHVARMLPPVHVHEGLRTEPKAPRFNIAARAFLTSPQLQRVPPLSMVNQNDGSDIEEFPDDRTTRRRLFTPSSRRVTEDHSHNIRQQQQLPNHSAMMAHNPPSARAAVALHHQLANNSTVNSSTCNLPRPWETSTTTARRRRLRDATANPSNARSIVAKRTTSVAAPRQQQQQPATSTTSLQQASADLWFRQPPTNATTTTTTATHSNVATIRNDLQGGSGVGAGNYSFQSSQRNPRQEQDEVEDEVSATTTKSRGKARSKKASTTTTTRKRSRSTTAAGGAKKKRGGWGGKRRGKKKGGARGGASNFKRGAGNRGASSSGEGVWGSETVTWQPPPSNSRQDSTLQHVGGAEITF